MKRITILTIAFFCLSISAQEKICLQEGTRISVKITTEMSSQHYTNPTTIVASDVYDQDGEYIIIKKGTPVEIQTKIIKATLFGDEGTIELTPISTLAIDGREIVFQDQPVTFEGNEALLRSRKKAKIAAGTAFAAYTANTYCFKIEKLEQLQANE